MQITKSGAVKEINEVGCFSVAAWIAVAAGKCHTLRPFGVACGEQRYPARRYLTLVRNLGARMLN